MEYTFDCPHAGQDPNFRNVPAGYINKTVCGCGITSVAIEGDEDCVIAVPNVSLVINKISQYYNTQLETQGDPNSGARSRFGGEIFGVYGDIEESDIYKYVQRVREAKTPIKIMVTYDSLSKCFNYLKTDWCIENGKDEGKCHLIIDESDKLISYMSMKVSSKKPNQVMDIVTYLFKVAELCKSTVSFISATPINVSFLPEWVGGIEQVSLYWKDTRKVTPITLKRLYPYNALQEEVIMPIKKKGSVTLGDREIKKVIVFINSVDKIMQIIKECQIDRDDCAIICGDNSRNSYKIRGYNSVDNPYHLPRFTFVTSSGFQGIDLVDNEAMNVVVSYTSKTYQMVDINTDLIQATSRQRDKSNPNFDRFVYIYDQNEFEKSEEELKADIEAVHQRIADNCRTLARIDKESSEYESAVVTFNQSADFRKYTYKLNKEADYELNEIVFKAEEYQILETRRKYREGFDIVTDLSRGVEPIVVEEPNNPKTLSYRSIMYKYQRNITLQQPKWNLETGEITYYNGVEPELDANGRIKVDLSIFSEDELATKYFEIIDKYYKAYGKFHTNITYARNMARVVDDADRFRVDIQLRFKKGRYSLDEIKDGLNEIYRKYKITRRAKDSDLSEYGYVIKRVRPQGYIYVDILETPKID